MSSLLSVVCCSTVFVDGSGVVALAVMGMVRVVNAVMMMPMVYGMRVFLPIRGCLAGGG